MADKNLSGSSCFVFAIFSGLLGLSACVHGTGGSNVEIKAPTTSLVALQMDHPIELRLKADLMHQEKVAYFSRTNSESFEDNQVRHQKNETLEFTSQAETVKADPSSDRFTQALTIISKDGQADLHDYAMPDQGERLEVTADSHGRILRAGDYPTNSIFYVSPISLPSGSVSQGDTWTMTANWVSLDESVPYRLDMVSILKGFWTCGKDRCAQIEVSGEVGIDGMAGQSMSFKSLWRGMLYFDIDAGTVVWSRVDSDEQFAAGNVRRNVSSCLEAALIEPAGEKLAGLAKPNCEWRKSDSLSSPSSMTQKP